MPNGRLIERGGKMFGKYMPPAAAWIKHEHLAHRVRDRAQEDQKCQRRKKDTDLGLMAALPSDPDPDRRAGALLASSRMEADPA